MKKSAILLLSAWCLALPALAGPEATTQPAPPARPRNVTFVSTSDCHYKAFEAQAWNAYDRQTIDEINRIAGQSWPDKLGADKIDAPRGVVVLGDCVDDGDKKIQDKDYTAQQARAFLADFGLDGTDGVLKYRAYETWGNHDGPPAGKNKNSSFSVQAELKKRNALRKEKGWLTGLSESGMHYSWDWDDVHFVMLGLYPADRQNPKVHYSPVWHDPQGALTFLKQDLEKNVGASGRAVVLMSHAGFDTDWWIAEDWKAAYEAARDYNVILYLYGHTGTGLKDWAPAGEARKWTCINDGNTTAGFFVVQIVGDRLRAGYRCKENVQITKNPDKTITRAWAGQWGWKFLLDRTIVRRSGQW